MSYLTACVSTNENVQVAAEPSDTIAAVLPPTANISTVNPPPDTAKPSIQFSFKEKGDQVEIVLNGKYRLTWSNTTFSFNQNKEGKPPGWLTEMRSALCHAVLQKEKTPVKICATFESPSTLDAGGVAFLILDRYEHVPWFQVFSMQFDVFEMGCPFPSGLWNFIQSHKERVKEDLLRHYEEK